MSDNAHDRRAAVIAAADAMTALNKLDPEQATVIVASMLSQLYQRLPDDDRDGFIDALVLLACVPVPITDA
jgi:hypothetical protein